MKTPTRFASGVALMTLLIAIVAGLLACMPVPIGDPERSRIDPEISGVWAWLDDDDSAGFYVFEPYDKRTWLLTGFGFSERDDATDYDLSTYQGLADLIDNEPVGPDGVTTGEVTLYKVWRTKLGGEWFMTWEPKGILENEGLVPEVWYVFRILRPDANTIELQWIKDDLFEGVEESRRAFERVIRKNVNNPELYDDEKLRLVRIDSEHFEFVGDLAAQVISE